MRSSHVSPGLWLAYAAFLVYGSLVPLDYQHVPLDQAWQAFGNIPFLDLGLESRADWIANGVLYVPLGYLTATMLSGSLGRAPRLPASLSALLLCAGLALGIEFTQLYFPPRTVSLNDVLAEGIGSVLGVAVSPFLTRLLARFEARRQLGGREFTGPLLKAYVVVYVLLCLFPYDLLLSMQELRSKVESASWGWWLAGAAPRPALASMQLAVEIVLALPYGLLLARRGNRAGIGLARAAGLGLLLGAGIEAGQFLIASGISQGASVLSRTAGVVLGAALWRARDRFGPDRLSDALRRYAAALGIAWAFVLAVINGWFVYSWQGLDGAAAQWQALRLLPFYYHYYTTEAQALFSLGSVALMYLPLAVLGWARRWSTATTAAYALVACLVVEASKLFLEGAHPDPTNILIAVTACALVRRMLASWARRAVASPPAAGRLPGTLDALPGNSAGRVAARKGRRPSAVLMSTSLAVVGVSAMQFPTMPGFLVLLLGACAAAVWVRPVWAIAIVPAALPVWDLAPWSGRFYWDEFDLLTLVCLAVGAHRTMPRDGRREPVDALTLAFAFLALSLAVSSVRAFVPWQWPDPNSFASYYSPYNALRIAKGALWAWGYVWLYRRLAAAGTERERMFAWGMNLGLGLTTAFIVWERLVFVGLFDFASDYRVTGPISAMHKGGAYIECYLAVASAFAVTSLVQARTWTARLAGALLLLGAAYGVTVTFSRNGYAAFALVMTLVFSVGLLRALHDIRQAAARLVLLLLVGGMAASVVAGPFARERFAHTWSDLAVRQAHWADALRIRDPDGFTELFGMGLGRFPETHFWRSTEALHAGSYRLEQEAGNAYLRLGAGASIYVEQFVQLAPDRDYVLSARLRSNRPSGAIGVALCQKWMLTSMQCESAPLAGAPVPGVWQRVEVRLKASLLTVQPWHARRPLKLALVSPSQNLSVDVDDVRLTATPDANALANGDFSAGLDHWFFTTDVDPPWHIHSLPVAIVFDQGWLGVMAWSALCCVGLARGAAKAYRGSATALAASAAVLAFLVSGSLNTLIDAPRFLWLLLVLIWLCGARRNVETEPAAARVAHAAAPHASVRRASNASA